MIIKKTKNLWAVLALSGAVCLPKYAFAADTPFKFVYNNQTYEVSRSELNSWRGAGELPKKNILQKQTQLNDILAGYLGQETNRNFSKENYQISPFRPEKIYEYLKTLSTEVNTAKVEPSLKIEGNRAINFSAPRDGVVLNIYDTTLKAIQALKQQAVSQALIVEVDQPQGRLSDTNNLGINELVAMGGSNFKGSPKNRIHNIKVGISKFKGIILKPQEQFSFNKYLGPVEEAQGFLPELVIKKEGTVPEFGGGLCQVSTTTFRAAMNAGLPITARKNHAYAVQYYSPQGTDATIYPGSADLKFINDTPAAILIWPHLEEKDTLVFDFYGTKDDRQVVLDKPVQWDRKADGSMKASWTRHVTKDGVTKDDTFKSIYQSPALFHKQEQFVSATGTPTSGLRMPKTN